jgi:hypothetical protein
MTNKEITKEDKLEIVASRIHDLKINKFNLELTLLEEASISSPNTDDVDSINLQIEVYSSKITALENKYTIIQSE